MQLGCFIIIPMIVASMLAGKEVGIGVNICTTVLMGVKLIILSLMDHP